MFALTQVVRAYALLVCATTAAIAAAKVGDVHRAGSSVAAATNADRVGSIGSISVATVGAASPAAGAACPAVGAAFPVPGVASPSSAFSSPRGKASSIATSCEDTSDGGGGDSAFGLFLRRS